MSITKLSIIIPVYNVEQYLDECIQSILSQTFKDWELILVDDGSTDASGAICDRYATKHTNIIVHHQQNAGQSVARNWGLDHAHGEYITFIDSDDYLIGDNTLALWMSKMYQHPDLDFAQFPHIRIRENGETLHVSKHQEIILSSKKDIIENLEHSSLSKNLTITGAPWGKIYKCNVFTNIRFPEGMIYEDAYLLCDIFDISHKVGIFICGNYCYRIRIGSTICFTGQIPLQKALDRITMQLRVLKCLQTYSDNKTLIRDLRYDIIQRFLYVRRTYGDSPRFKSLWKQFDILINHHFPYWNFRTWVKAVIVSLFGINALANMR